MGINFMNRTELGYLAHFVDLADIRTRSKSEDESIGHHQFTILLKVYALHNLVMIYVVQKATQAEWNWLKINIGYILSSRSATRWLEYC